LLLILGLGAAHLGIGGLIKLRPGRGEFWLFGLGVRTKLGAVKVLFVAVALLVLAYSLHRKGSIVQILRPEQTSLEEHYKGLASRIEETEKAINTYKSEVATLQREKEDCQNIVSRQGLGLANKADLMTELRTSVNVRQKENAGLQESLRQAREQIGLLQKEHDQIFEAYNQTKEKTQQLESQVDVLQNEKVSLKLKLEQAATQNEAEVKRLLEEAAKLKALYRDEEHRASLLRQGLVLREANDWTLEREIQRLANLIADQPDVSSPRQAELSRALHNINQILREGAAVTKQAKVADTPSAPVKPAMPVQDKTGKVPVTKQDGP
jgi:chromosome segregation ATPase